RVSSRAHEEPQSGLGGSACAKARTAAATFTMTDVERPAKSVPVASATAPARMGPIGCPAAKAMVNIASAAPQASRGKECRPMAVTAAGGMKKAPPKRAAEATIAQSEVLTSGIAAPTAH